jgi:hypothetical protein
MKKSILNRKKILVIIFLLVLAFQNNQKLNPGTHRLKVPVDNLNSGIYFASIIINETVLTRKVHIE